MTLQQEIWVATALLHCENPARSDFTVAEIVARAVTENPAAGFRTALSDYAIHYCVATTASTQGRNCVLTATRPDRRRLFRPGDPFHPSRSANKVHPDKSDLSPRYRRLIDWYQTEYIVRPPSLPSRARAGAAQL